MKGKDETNTNRDEDIGMKTSVIESEEMKSRKGLLRLRTSRANGHWPCALESRANAKRVSCLMRVSEVRG